MADEIYQEFKEDCLDGTGPDLTGNPVHAVLIDEADYTRSTGNGGHATMADVAGAAQVATSAAIGGKSVAGRTFDLADYTFTSVTGDECEAILYYEERSAAAAGRFLIIIKDSATGLPVTPNGGDINVTINASGLFGI